MANITAHRDGQTREFTPKQWEVMGIGKCGWSAVPELPKEVAKAVASVAPIIEEAPTQTRKKRRK